MFVTTTPASARRTSGLRPKRSARFPMKGARANWARAKAIVMNPRAETPAPSSSRRRAKTGMTMP
jgi:hypothetical protein